MVALTTGSQSVPLSDRLKRPKGGAATSSRPPNCLEFASPKREVVEGRRLNWNQLAEPSGPPQLQLPPCLASQASLSDCVKMWYQTSAELVRDERGAAWSLRSRGPNGHGDRVLTGPPVKLLSIPGSCKGWGTCPSSPIFRSLSHKGVTTLMVRDCLRNCRVPGGGSKRNLTQRLRHPGQA